MSDRAERARIYAALGDLHRLEIVDELTVSDRAPSELGSLLGIDSNLLAHHLGVLEALNVVRRVSSQGDRRRRYVQLVPATIASVAVGMVRPTGHVVFVCTENSGSLAAGRVVLEHSRYWCCGRKRRNQPRQKSSSRDAENSLAPWSQTPRRSSNTNPRDPAYGLGDNGVR